MDTEKTVFAMASSSGAVLNSRSVSYYLSASAMLLFVLPAERYQVVSLETGVTQFVYCV